MINLRIPPFSELVMAMFRNPLSIAAYVFLSAPVFGQVSEERNLVKQLIYEDDRFTVEQIGTHCQWFGEVIIKSKGIDGENFNIPDYLGQIVTSIATEDCSPYEPLDISYLKSYKYSALPSQPFSEHEQRNLDWFYLQTPLAATAKESFEKIISEYGATQKPNLNELLTDLATIRQKLINEPVVIWSQGKFKKVEQSQRRELLNEVASTVHIEPDYVKLTREISSFFKSKGELQPGDTLLIMTELSEQYPLLFLWLSGETNKKLREFLYDLILQSYRQELTKVVSLSNDGLKALDSHHEAFSGISNISNKFGTRFIYHSSKVKTVYQETRDKLEVQHTNSVVDQLNSIKNPWQKIRIVKAQETGRFLEDMSHDQRQIFIAHLNNAQEQALVEINRSPILWIDDYLGGKSDYLRRLEELSNTLFSNDIKTVEFEDYPYQLGKVRDRLVKLEWEHTQPSSHGRMKNLAFDSRSFPNLNLMYIVHMFGIYEFKKLYSAGQQDEIIYYSMTLKYGNGPLAGNEARVGKRRGKLNLQTGRAVDYATGLSNKTCSIEKMKDIGLTLNRRLEEAPEWLSELYSTIRVDKVWLLKGVVPTSGKVCSNYQVLRGQSCPSACTATRKFSVGGSYIVATKAEAIRLNRYTKSNASDWIAKAGLDHIYNLEQMIKTQNNFRRQEQQRWQDEAALYLMIR